MLNLFITWPDLVFIVYNSKFSTITVFAGGSDGKESACKAGDPGLIPGSGRSPEEGMATHSSILAWRMPWTEEPGGLKFMELQRVRDD